MYANRTPGRPRSRTSSDPGQQPPIFVPYKHTWPAPARRTTDPPSHPAYMMNQMPSGHSSRAPSRSSSVERNDPFVPAPGSLLAQMQSNGMGMSSDPESRYASTASTPASARSPSPGGYFNRPPSHQSFSRGSNNGYAGPGLGGGGGSVSGASFKNGGGSISGGPLIRDVPQPSRTAVNADVGPPPRSFDGAYNLNQGRNFAQAPHPASLQPARRDAPPFPQAQLSMPVPHQQMHPNQLHRSQPPSPASDVQHRETYSRHDSFQSATSHQSFQARPSQHQQQQQQQEQNEPLQLPPHPFAGAQLQSPHSQSQSPNSAHATFQSRQRVHERPPSAASHRYAASLTPQPPVYGRSGQSSGTLGGSGTSLVPHGRSSSFGASPGGGDGGPGMQTHGGPGSPPPPPLPAHGSVRGRPGPEVNGRRGSSGRSSSLPRTSQNGDYGLGAGYHEHSNPHYLEKPDAHGPARASATGGTGDGALEPKHSVSGRKTPLSKTVSTTATTKRRKNTSFAGNDGSDAEKGTTSQQRPPLPPTSSSGLAAQTRYVNMLLALDDIPELFNMGASFATWILLAGYVLFPGTFDTLSSQQGLGSAETLLVNAVTDIPLFVIAWICTGIGAVGMCYLWWRWQNNYIWLCNRIFLPGLLNSLAGIISTLTSVFGAQHGVFTATSKSTIIVTGAVAGICAALFGFYQFVLVRRIRREHQKTVGIEMAGRHGEGVVGEVRRRRKARERAREREML